MGAYVEVGESRIFKNTLVGQLSDNPTLSKDLLTRINAGIFYMKHKLFTTANHDTMLKFGRDCEVCFWNTLEARIVKNRDRPNKNIAPIKVWFDGSVL